MRDTKDYLAWIADNVPGDGYGKCEGASRAMAKTFSELEVRHGHFYCYSWGRRAHWWCLRKEDDLIVDPTGFQYPTGFQICHDRQGKRYEDLTDCTREELLERVPAGVCMNCGCDVFKFDTFCSDACHDAVVAEFNAELGG